jgi:hypothetical protein
MTHEERRSHLATLAMDLESQLLDHEKRGQGLVAAYERYQHRLGILKSQLEHVLDVIKWFKNGGDPDATEPDEPIPF